MPYVTPHRWTHGEYPTAANLNTFKTGLDDIHLTLRDAQVNGAVRARMAGVQGYYFVNRCRWLLYLGDAKIQDPAGVGEEVTLGDTGGWAGYDLLQVEWIYPGKVYQVQDALACMEDVEGL